MFAGETGCQIRDGKFEVLACSEGALLCQDYDLLFNCWSIFYMVVSLHLMYQWQLILQMFTRSISNTRPTFIATRYRRRELSEFNHFCICLAQKLSRTLHSVKRWLRTNFASIASSWWRAKTKLLSSTPVLQRMHLLVFLHL
jgi:hypothetical protein